jgi:hypothetical protein
MPSGVGTGGNAHPADRPFGPVTSPSRQQPMTAWATWSGSTPTFAQVSAGQARSSTVRSSANTQLTWLPLSMAGEQLVDQAAGRLGDTRV